MDAVRDITDHKQQSAEIICDSIGINGVRLTTFLVEEWRGIHAEHLKHRTQSLSVSSSRAIPFKTQLKSVVDEPFFPIAYQKKHKGMQGTEYLKGIELKAAETAWRVAVDHAIMDSHRLDELGVTKQLCNRVLETYSFSRCVVTATEWNNFFTLRTGESAEIHINDLAVKMKSAMRESRPTFLNPGAYHLPFITQAERLDNRVEQQIQISAARCARTSYGKNIGKSIDDELILGASLLKDRHLVPFEHQAKALPDLRGVDSLSTARTITANNRGLEFRLNSDGEASWWSGNFRGWVQHRKCIKNEDGVVK